MKKSVEYLREAKEALGCESDYQLAKALKTSTVNISNYMNGISKMDDYHCIKVAQVLGIDPMEIIAAAQEEREKSEEKKEFWRDFRKARGNILGAAIALALGLTTALSPSHTEAKSYGPLYYVKYSMSY
ncbi:hypothetical protein C2134_13645 [Chromobacterium sinusclupearum]|uniref:HTH cro/C1-type domain-containing protein n=1 Tax=Chromobacterium sinusclupearum TaxID=2077146 RepID=A0A2K4MLS9_9NEIS|nr:helix-turn-helix transcriptional regulator [Chromobacterium sinusclupearum]POA98061.1 hypothetical protein C2134_13645 [Chromobacterium sinusclupearum]